MKKLLSCILSFCLCLGLLQPVYGIELQSIATDAIMSDVTHNAYVAHIENVNSTGTNLNNDIIDGKSKSIPTSAVSIGWNGNSINVNVEIDGSIENFSGTPIARTESGKTIFFDGISSNSKFEIVDFEYVMDLSVANLYFENTKRNVYSSTASVLKLYLKDISQNSLDFYLIEVFDVDLAFDNSLIQSLSIDPLMGAWAATQFEPIEEDFGEDFSEPVLVVDDLVPTAVPSYKNWYLSKTYNDLGNKQTHTIRWRTLADYANIPIGGEMSEIFRLNITAKSMTFDNNSDLNSDTTSFLHIDNLVLHLNSVSGTAWQSTTIDGNVQENEWGGGLSISLGIGVGPFSASFDALSFTSTTFRDLNDTYNSYENGLYGEYWRAINVDLNSSCKLTQIGHYFEVNGNLRDYENTYRPSEYLEATWELDIINANTNQHYFEDCSHNVRVAVS